MMLRSFLESHGALELYLNNLDNLRPRYRVLVFLIRSGLSQQSDRWPPIGWAFYWTVTPEGHHFWSDLDRSFLSKRGPSRGF